MSVNEGLFRHRFWVIALIFNAGFSSYFFDRENVAAAAVEAFGIDPESPGFGGWVRGALFAGALLGILGACLRTWATAYLTSDVVHASAVKTERLVADGPYRHVRNPLYLGLLLLASGFALCASRTGFVIIVVGMTAFVVRLIAYEEEGLARAQGESFEAYRRAVPRLLPSVLPRVPSSGRRPRYAQALLGEAFIWVFAAAGVALALTLDGRVFAAVCAGGMLAYWGAMAVAKRGKKTP